jgi:hypothetical protein
VANVADTTPSLPPVRVTVSVTDPPPSATDAADEVKASEPGCAMSSLEIDTVVAAVAPRVAPPVGEESVSWNVSLSSTSASLRIEIVIDFCATSPLAQESVPDFAV